MTQRTRTLTRPSLILGALAGIGLSAAAVNLTAPIRVVDGDTVDIGYRVAIGPARYRLAGIDTPETRGARCGTERALGKAAAERLRALLAGGNVSVSVHHARDKYARQIASLSHGGHDVGDTLTAEGLARPYSGRGKRAGWCPPTDISGKP